MCAGLGLLYLSHKRQLRRIVSGPSQLIGVDEYRNRENPGWLSLLGWVFLAALIGAPLLSLGYSLAYKGHPPMATSIPPPPICKTADCWPKPTQKARTIPRPSIVAPGGVFSFNQKGGITAGTVNVNERPLPEVKWSQEPLAGIQNGTGDYTHPGVKLHMSINARFEDPTFLARCDRPCIGIQGVPLNTGSFWPNSGTVDNNPNVAWLHFSLPYVLPAGQLIDWDIRSKDNQALKVLEVGPYRVP
jgi:hypothetical protein